ncbi:MAG: hypothetical protein U0573_06800 [Phycisphaerales bacterium]|nr:DinB family protein [Planctomycetota bacterium]
MGQFLDQIVAASRRGRGFAEKAVVGVTPQLFARKPRFETSAGVKVVDANHPAFVYGHLALYPARIGSMLDLDTSSFNAPADFSDLFKAGVECKDDPEGRIYPAMDRITAAFFSNYDALYEKMAKVDDSALLKATPEERYRAHFPTTGMAVAFMLTSHVMVHMGQVSTWRRCFGLPPLM